MERSLINVLLVDDEDIVREGLKHIIDWNSLGYCICGESSTGEDAIEKISTYQPGLVLLDIRMPKMYGTEVIEHVRKNGFQGDFIILSGYSDFKYAQAAVHYGVSYYLTKPIDEDELEQAALAVKEKINKRQNKAYSLNQYIKKAKTTVLCDLLTGSEFNRSINYLELGLSSPIYQVVIYEGYTPFFQSYSFADLLKISNHSNDSFEHLTIDHYNVILLKGNFALERFNACLRHYDIGTQKGSPLDTIFLSYGPTTSFLAHIHDSYSICRQLMDRRFFCEENQHVLSYEELPDLEAYPFILSSEMSKSYSTALLGSIQSFNSHAILEELNQLKNALYTSRDNVIDIKRFLADIFLQIKQSIMHAYSNLSIPFPPNASIIELIENKYYLYEILLYFTEQFDMIMRAIGNNGSLGVFDDILYYINHNYELPLKLESIAPLFGYNSSYLGKLFSQKMGISFNNYLDQIRINQAIKLLQETSLKVYEIATKVGYKNVDYFHQKFKKQKGISPAEFRKTL